MPKKMRVYAAVAPIRAGRPMLRRFAIASADAATIAATYHGFRHPCNAPSTAAHFAVPRKFSHATTSATPIAAAGAQRARARSTTHVDAVAGVFAPSIGVLSVPSPPSDPTQP